MSSSSTSTTAKPKIKIIDPKQDWTPQQHHDAAVKVVRMQLGRQFSKLAPKRHPRADEDDPLAPEEPDEDNLARRLDSVDLKHK